MNKGRRKNDVDLILSEAFGAEGKDEKNVSDYEAQELDDSALLDTAKQIKFAIKSDDDSAFYNGLMRFIDQYNQAKANAQAYNEDSW